MDRAYIAIDLKSFWICAKTTGAGNYHDGGAGALFPSGLRQIVDLESEVENWEDFS